jgi:hypothetical protein
MADAVQRLMTPEEFFRWQLDQEDLYELVEGIPVKMLKMMTGTSVQHDSVRGQHHPSLVRAQLAATRAGPTDGPGSP